MNPDRVFDEFPAPSYRGNQKRALERIRDAFAAGNRVVFVRAPTGSGKSLLARAVAGCARRGDEAEPSQATGAYYTTPQVSQLDDVAADPLLDDLAVIRGKSNYDCILPGETDTPVDRAPCVRRRGYDCEVRHRCPYFSDRAIASNRRIAATTLAYFMRTAGSDVFRKRDVVVVDEAHGLGEWAETYATIDLDARTLPNWDDLRVPEVDGIDRAVEYARHLIEVCTRRKDDLAAAEDLTPAEAGARDRYRERISELRWFVEDYRDPGSPTTWLVDQDSGDAADEGGPITIKPTNPARYLRHTVWDRGNRFALLSATILEKAAFCRQVGLDPDDVALVEVDHTFPLEHRPLYDATCGKMTYEHRDETLPAVARTLVRIMQRHPGEKGIVHCHSYAIQRRLADRLADHGVGPRVRSHGRDGRDDALAAWQATDDPDAFLSVKMEEALDLEDDLARWQVLCKAPFPNTRDSRVAHRLSEGQWGWYYRSALRTVIQACGRVVRSPEDRGATYLADDSLLDLFERAREATPDWFAAQVDRTTDPDLPGFDPADALGAVDGGPANRRRRGSHPSNADVDDGAGDEDASGTTTAEAAGEESGGGAADAGAASDRSEAGARGRRRSSGGRRRDSGDSPVADVWDTDG